MISQWLLDHVFVKTITTREALSEGLYLGIVFGFIAGTCLMLISR